MKKDKLFWNTRVRRVGTAIALLSALSGCTTHFAQQRQVADDLAALRQCASDQQQQAAQFAQQQTVLAATLDDINRKLALQQKTLDEKPRIVERQIKQVNCPSLEQVAPKRIQPSETTLSDKQIVGLREQILLAGASFVMNAKISTTVANSVIDARNIQMFERNGEEWVRFTLYNPETNEPHVLERKRLRFQALQTTNPNPDRRPVVEIRFTIGKLSQRGEFVLADRSQADSPVLIGRNILRDVMLVDVSGDNLAPLQRRDAVSSAATSSVSTN